VNLFIRQHATDLRQREQHRRYGGDPRGARLHDRDRRTRRSCPLLGALRRKVESIRCSNALSGRSVLNVCWIMLLMWICS
jgi:hypothetical protein